MAKITPENFTFAGIKRAIPNRQDRLILPARVTNQNTQEKMPYFLLEHRIRFILPARGASHIKNLLNKLLHGK